MEKYIGKYSVKDFFISDSGRIYLQYRHAQLY